MSFISFLKKSEAKLHELNPNQKTFVLTSNELQAVALLNTVKKDFGYNLYEEYLNKQAWKDISKDPRALLGYLIETKEEVFPHLDDRYAVIVFVDNNGAWGRWKDTPQEAVAIYKSLDKDELKQHIETGTEVFNFPTSSYHYISTFDIKNGNINILEYIGDLPAVNSSLKLSSETYFDATPSEMTIPEERTFVNPLPDSKLRRTNPKRYEIKRDFYKDPMLDESQGIQNRADEVIASLDWEIDRIIESYKLNKTASLNHDYFISKIKQRYDLVTKLEWQFFDVKIEDSHNYLYKLVDEQRAKPYTLSSDEIYYVHSWRRDTNNLKTGIVWISKHRGGKNGDDVTILPMNWKLFKIIFRPIEKRPERNASKKEVTYDEFPKDVKEFIEEHFKNVIEKYPELKDYLKTVKIIEAEKPSHYPSSTRAEYDSDTNIISSFGPVDEMIGKLRRGLVHELTHAVQCFFEGKEEDIPWLTKPLSDEYYQGDLELYWNNPLEEHAYSVEREFKQTITSSLSLNWLNPLGKEEIKKGDIVKHFADDKPLGRVMMVGPARLLVNFDYTGALKEGLDEGYIDSEEPSAAVDMGTASVVYVLNELEVYKPHDKISSLQLTSSYDEYTEENKNLFEERYNTYGDDGGKLFWSSSHGQKQRFKALLAFKKFPKFYLKNNPAILDIGCGYGDFISFVKDEYDIEKLNYIGTELVPQMIEIAKQKHPNAKFELRDIVKNPYPDNTFDLVIGSGLFALNHPQWKDFVFQLVNQMYKCSKGVVAINFLQNRPSDQKFKYTTAKEVGEILSKITSNIHMVEGYLPDDFTVYLFKNTELQLNWKLELTPKDFIGKLVEVDTSNILKAGPNRFGAITGANSYYMFGYWGATPEEAKDNYIKSREEEGIRSGSWSWDTFKDNVTILEELPLFKKESNLNLNWQIQFSNPEFEQILKEGGYSYHIENEWLIIDNIDNDNGNDHVYLDFLTSLPNNVLFTNNGDVSLDSLTSLPENTQFNNKGGVFLFSLTSLLNNVLFNNKEGVYLRSLISLPENKYEIFRNSGVVYYNWNGNRFSIFNPHIREGNLNLDWQEQFEEDLDGYINYIVDYIYNKTGDFMRRYVLGKNEKEQREEIESMIMNGNKDDGYMRVNVYDLWESSKSLQEAAEELNSEVQYWLNNSARVM